jgi:hypothetical protein
VRRKRKIHEEKRKNRTTLSILRMMGDIVVPFRV